MRKHLQAGTAMAFFAVPAAALAAAHEEPAVSPAAARELPALCANRAAYPDASAWKPDASFASVHAATGGTPLIEQYRGGKRIARYTSFADRPGCSYAGDGTDHVTPNRAASTGCGPFTRAHAFRMWEPGDRFLVYPAVYRGPENNPFIGPAFDDAAGFDAKITHAPDHVQISGVVKNGVRPVILLEGAASDNTLGQAPVYFDRSTGLVFENIDVVAVQGSSVGKAGLYDVGATDLTLRHVRISGFAAAGGNGLFGAGQYGGTMLLDHVELDHDGGTNGPAHNAYINASAIDPKFTVRIEHSWSHDAYYGHLFKSRAQNTIVTDTLFQGGRPQPGFPQAEAYLLDVPNGGGLTVRNSVFIKDASGENSNGMSIAYAEEGVEDGRAQSLDIEGNSFIALAKNYDGFHSLFPFRFFTPPQVPGRSGWPDVPATVENNVFAGYCATDDAKQDYRGDGAVIKGFSERPGQ